MEQQESSQACETELNKMNGTTNDLNGANAKTALKIVLGTSNLGKEGKYFSFPKLILAHSLLLESHSVSFKRYSKALYLIVL